MRCRHVERLLDRYFDDELPHAQRARVAQHLDDCEACRARLRELTQLADATKDALDEASLDDEFDRAVMAAVARQPRRILATITDGVARLLRRPLVWWEWLRGPGRKWNWVPVAATVTALIVLSEQVNELEEHVGPRQTIVLGQSTWAWNSPASLRVVTLEDEGSGTVLSDAPVRISVRPQRGGRWRRVFSGRSNRLGSVDATFHLPENVEGQCLLRVDTGRWRSRDRIVRPITIERKAKVLLSTDKPLYQPGQTIHMRLLAMYVGAKKAVAGREATIEVKDPKGTRVFRKEAKTSEYGISSADFQLAAEVNNGRYQIVARVGDDETEKTVTVEPYVLPKFRVEAKTMRPYYAPGDTVRGTVKALYFFGKPVANAEVKVRLAAFDTESHDVETLEGKTEVEGVFDFEARLPEHFAGHPLERGHALVRLIAEVTDTAGHMEEVSESVPVAAEAFEIAVVPESGEPAWGLENVFYIVTSYPDGSPAETRGTVSPSSGGQVPFQTDATGIAQVQLSVGQEALRLQVDAQDEQQQRVHTARDFGRDRYSHPSDAILLRTDKVLYRVGETVMLEALASQRTGTVYFDISREGQTVLTRCGELESGRCRFALDLSEDLAGTLTLHAYVLTSDYGMVRDTRTIIVRSAEDLQVAVTASKATYRPGDEATLRFAVTGPDGRGVPGALGVGVVDESVFALRERDAALERDYFAMEKEILEPRYQDKFFLPPGLLSSATLDSSSTAATQRRAAVALAALSVGPQSEVPPTDSWRRANWRSRYGLREAGYSLAAKSRQQRLSRARGIRDWYFSALCWAIGLAVLGAVGLLLSRIRWSQTGAGLTAAVTACLIVCALSLTGQRVRNQFVTVNTNISSTVDSAAMKQMRAMAKEPLTSTSDADTPQAQAGELTTTAEPPRLRQFFPETLFWQPELIADENGEAELTIPMADSITTWRLSALASTTDGRVGSTTAGIRVFQDFFIDLDLPVALTQGDWISIPVAVHNYLPKPQTVKVTLDHGDWFELSGEATREVTLPGNEVGVVHFSITAQRFGRFTLTVTGRGERMSDAMQREIDVLPNGEKVVTTVSDRLTGDVTRTLDFPPDAIPGTEKLLLKIHPGVFSQIVEGLDGLLQVPFGCFEQTSSITYPNILILDYLKRTKKSTPEVQMKAEEFINLGYQRILTFETPGGGFDWFGTPPAKTILTAYGVLELTDMARLMTVDERLIYRAKGVLLKRQRSDGSWALDIEMHTWFGVNSELPITAYVAWALAHGGGAEAAVGRGLGYLEAQADQLTDPYVLALAANAFATGRPKSSTTRRLLERLDGMKTIEKDAAHWATKLQTLTYGGDEVASVETTALAAQAFLRAGYHTDTATKALTYLIQQREPHGAWQTTQATILALQALTLASEGLFEKGTATVQVQVNGKDADTIRLTEKNADVMQQVDLTSYLQTGGNSVKLSVDGRARPMYQLVAKSHVPWGAARKAAKPNVEIKVAYDRSELRQNDVLTANVSIRSNAKQTLPMLIADLGVAPGFAPDRASLEALVAEQLVERFEITPRQILLYLRDLPAGKTVQFAVRLRARFPVRATVPPSAVYEYYNPSNRDVTPSAKVAVTA